jgi:hypothetical protein
MRFALLELKLGLAALLRKYTFLPCEKTVDRIVPWPANILGMNKEGIWAVAEERKLIHVI